MAISMRVQMYSSISSHLSIVCRLVCDASRCEPGAEGSGVGTLSLDGLVYSVYRAAAPNNVCLTELAGTLQLLLLWFTLR